MHQKSPLIARTAIVSHKAKVAKTAKIDHFAIIEDGCEIGDGAIVGDHATLRRNTKLGKNSIFGAHSRSEGDVTIGDGVTIGPECVIAIGTVIDDGAFIGPYFCAMNTKVITPGFHGTKPSFKPKYEVTRIGRCARIGGQVAMTPGHTIGDYAVVDQHTFLTKDVPPYTHVRNAPPELLVKNDSHWETFSENKIVDSLGMEPDAQIRVCDAHIHLGHAINSFFDTGMLERAMSNYKISRALVMSGNSEPERWNKRVIELGQQDKRIVPFLWFIPKPAKVSHIVYTGRKDIVQKLREDKIAGIKYHGAYNKMPVNSLKLSMLWRDLSDVRATVLVHTGMYMDGAPESDTSYIHALNLAARFNKLTVILAHMGGSTPSIITRCADEIQKRSLHNVYLDTSGMVPRTDLLEYVVKQVGKVRVLFGSDMPLCSFNAQKQLVLDSNLDEQAKAEILHGNFDRLFPSRSK